MKLRKKGDYETMIDTEEVQQIIMRRMLTLSIGIREDRDEDDDDGDTFDMWDITVEDVEWIRKFFNVPDEIDEIVQPLIPEPIHTTAPNDDYVAPATKSISDELLEEFRNESLNVTMVDEEADFNPTKDLEELERLLAGYNSEEMKFEVTSTRNYVVMLLLLQQLWRNQHSYAVIIGLTA
ncbi:hypothetical protein Tco_1251696 [Tanacetum coccineum]